MRGIAVVPALLAGLLATAALAQGARPVGFYGGVGAGGSIVANTDATQSGVEATLETHPGFAVGAQAGYRFGNGFRTEAEFAYGQNELKEIRSGATVIKLSGKEKLMSGTLGLFYDFNLGGRLSPFIGGGAGVMKQKIGRVTGTFGGTTVTVSGGDSTDMTAYGEAGFSFAVTERIEIVPTYRFQWIDDGDSNTDSTRFHLLKVSARIFF